MSVRISGGLAQLGGDPIFELFRYVVFQPLRLFMHFVPGVVKNLMQESFEQAMMPYYLQSPAPASQAQAHAVMLLILHEGRVLRREFLKHSRYRCRPDTQVVREDIAADGLFLRATQFQNRLQVIVHRL